MIRFHFVEKHQFKSYAPDSVVVGSAAKEVEVVQEKIIKEIQVKPGHFLFDSLVFLIFPFIYFISLYFLRKACGKVDYKDF